MRISDWSSDVCSADLARGEHSGHRDRIERWRAGPLDGADERVDHLVGEHALPAGDAVDRLEHLVALGQATEDAHGADAEEAVDAGPVEAAGQGEHPHARPCGPDLDGEVADVAVDGGAKEPQ